MSEQPVSVRLSFEGMFQTWVIAMILIFAITGGAKEIAQAIRESAKHQKCAEVGNV